MPTSRPPTNAARLGGWLAGVFVAGIALGLLVLMITQGSSTSTSPASSKSATEQWWYGPSDPVRAATRRADTAELKRLQPKVSDLGTKLGSQLRIPAVEILLQPCEDKWEGRSRFISQANAYVPDEAPRTVMRALAGRMAQLGFGEASAAQIRAGGWRSTDRNGIRAAAQAVAQGDKGTRATVVVATRCLAVASSDAKPKSEDSSSPATAETTPADSSASAASPPPATEG